MGRLGAKGSRLNPNSFPDTYYQFDIRSNALVAFQCLGSATNVNNVLLELA